MTPTRSLQEVIFALHFAEPLPMRTVDVASWAVRFGGEDASYQELPPLPGTIVPVPDQAYQNSGLTLLTNVVTPRLRVVNNLDAHEISVLQADRVAFGWQRNIEVGIEADYPGYDALKDRWQMQVAQFSDWAFDRFSQRIRPRLVELSYNNAYPIDVGGRTRRLAEICKLIRPGIRPVNALQISWAEFIESGRGTVQAAAGVGSAPGGLAVVGVNYFGLINSRPHDPNHDMDSVLDDMNLLHDHILQMHQAAVEEGA